MIVEVYTVLATLLSDDLITSQLHHAGDDLCEFETAAHRSCVDRTLRTAEQPSSRSDSVAETI